MGPVVMQNNWTCCDTLLIMLSGDPLGDIFRSLPRPILYGILTGIALAHFSGVAVPQLQWIDPMEYDQRWVEIAKYSRAVIVLMPAPVGFAVFAFFLAMNVVAALRGQGK